jgi:hypothetical protein
VTAGKTSSDQPTIGSVPVGRSEEHGGEGGRHAAADEVPGPDRLEGDRQLAQLFHDVRVYSEQGLDVLEMSPAGGIEPASFERRPLPRNEVVSRLNNVARPSSRALVSRQLPR